MKYTYTAVLKNGAQVRAEKRYGKWLIGGDGDTSMSSYIVRSDGTQFALKGCMLIRV